MNNNIIKDINYALVEDKRPPLYTAMKYWGKKPHNIWRKYISNYTAEGEFYLDPFSGSAMSAFEGFKAGKKVLAFDINPLTSFFVEVFSSPFDKIKFEKEASLIINRISNNPLYRRLYKYNTDYKDFQIQNVKWNKTVIYEVCLQSDDEKERICLKPQDVDYNVVADFSDYIINNKYPQKCFRDSISYSNSFKENIGTKFSDLYTKRNLWVLSEIFNSILSVDDNAVKKQLLFAFIQTVHLSTKMCVPRGKSTNRDYSTSWGRSAYIYSKKQMEMNPLLVFKGNCFGKQSASSALEFADSYFARKPKIADINQCTFDANADIDIWYGIVDIKHLSDFLPAKTIGFVLTDPPYGGLVQYLDLSSVWLSWLEIYDKKYEPTYSKEITVNKDNSYEDFEKELTCALSNIRTVLKDDGKLVLTFNNSDLKIWSSFLSSITNAGFEIEKVIHQQNKRTGESNVSNSYGTSACDFYIRCIKSSKSELINLPEVDLDNLIIEKVYELISERNEPTPFQILFNGLLAKLSTEKVKITSFDSDFKNFMRRQTNVHFYIYKEATNKAGEYWWICDKKYDPFDETTLTNKLKKYINQIFEKYKKLKNNDVLGYIFAEFQNGMTPDIEVIYMLLNEVALQDKDIWVKK